MTVILYWSYNLCLICDMQIMHIVNVVASIFYIIYRLMAFRFVYCLWTMHKKTHSRKVQGQVIYK